MPNMRILVVEDDANTAALMQQGLTQEGFDVETCADGAAGLARARAARPDLMILDVVMPNLDGWQVLGELRSEGSALPVVMLTARDAVEHRVQGLTLGADDYLVKPFALSELVARIRTVLRRAAPPAGDVLAYADLKIDTHRHKVYRGETTIDLSSKEFQLLLLLLQRQGEILSRNFISKQVWDVSFEGESNVVDVNIRRLRAKVDEPFDVKLIQTVRGRGYVLR